MADAPRLCIADLLPREMAPAVTGVIEVGLAGDEEDARSWR